MEWQSNHIFRMGSLDFQCCKSIAIQMFNKERLNRLGEG